MKHKAIKGKRQENETKGRDQLLWAKGVLMSAEAFSKINQSTLKTHQGSKAQMRDTWMDYLLAGSRRQNNYQLQWRALYYGSQRERGPVETGQMTRETWGRNWLIRNMKPFTLLQAWLRKSTVPWPTDVKQQKQTHKLSPKRDRSIPLILNLCFFKRKRHNEHIIMNASLVAGCKPRSRCTRCSQGPFINKQSHSGLCGPDFPISPVWLPPSTCLHGAFSLCDLALTLTSRGGTLYLWRKS